MKKLGVSMAEKIPNALKDMNADGGLWVWSYSWLVFVIAYEGGCYWVR